MIQIPCQAGSIIHTAGGLTGMLSLDKWENINKIMIDLSGILKQNSRKFPRKWLIVPLRHLCGYLACYGDIIKAGVLTVSLLVNRETLLPS